MGLGNPPATPNAFPDQSNPISLTGQIDSDTGAITGASLTFPPIPQPPNTGETPTFTIGEVHPGTATGTFDSTTGAVTLNDALTITLTVEPIGFVCTSKPVNVALSGTWDSATQDVTLATTSSFTIPQFPSASPCSSLATPSLNQSPGGVAGSVGNSLTVALNGQFAPGLPTATTLAASPDSPQLAGTSVTLTATVAPQSGSGTPTGTVNFEANGQILGTEPLSGGTATLTTTTLPQTANQLSAVYSGDTTYATSTSSTVPYTIQPAPTITSTFPSQIAPGLNDFPAPTPFTVTISNPVGGATYSNDLFTYLGFNSDGMFEGSGPSQIQFSYQDPAGNWCPLTTSVDRPSGTSLPSGASGAYLGGPGTATCQFGSAFSLDPGASLTLDLEVAFTQAPYQTQPAYGPLYFVTALETGSCTSQSSCTATAPLEGKTAVTSQGASTAINPAAPGGIPTAIEFSGTPGPNTTSTIRSGNTVQFYGQVEVDPSYSNDYYIPAGMGPSGTVQVYLDGTLATTYTLSSGGYFGQSQYYNPGPLAPGTHTETDIYSGDLTFAPSTGSYTFAVIGHPVGTPYVCAATNVEGSLIGNVQGYVTATGTGVPTAATSGTSVTASNVSVSLDLDSILGANVASLNPQSNLSIGFSPGSEALEPASTTFTLSPTTPPKSWTDVIGTWSGLSTTVTVTGSPGDEVPVGVGSISFDYSFNGSVSCTPVSQPAAIGTVGIIGTTLTASPSSSAPVGAPVTLTAAVAPMPPSGNSSGGPSAPGQVDFFDGTTYLGTATVAASGAAAGTASLTVNTLPVGDHQLSAVWSGYSGVPPSTSNTVDYAVGTTTTTSLASSANPANAANPATFTATVSPPLGALTQPTGDVSFTADGNPISSCQNVALSMASPPTATCTTSFAAGTTHSIVATYSGDGTYLGSASDPLTQTMLPGTNTTILSTKDPSPAGNVTFWSGVSPSSGTGATPTGTVAFTIDGATYKPCNAQPLGPGGGASCTVSFKAGTTHKVFATYAGSSSYSGSKSSTITQTVTGAKSSTTPKDSAGSATLASGKALTAGQSIATGSYTLVMQSDGNLVEYQGSKVLWASGTSGHPGAGVTMQKDGNLVEYQGGKAIWASNTSGHSGAHLTLQGSDGNVVIYTPAGQAVWATGT